MVSDVFSSIVVTHAPRLLWAGFSAARQTPVPAQTYCGQSVPWRIVWRCRLTSLSMNLQTDSEL